MHYAEQLNVEQLTTPLHLEEVMVKIFDVSDIKLRGSDGYVGVPDLIVARSNRGRI